ncbi:MAG: hypothetical protein BRD30_03990 [Bacteroidetes bacterium QH_2_63_10]|nr:MAG: hypothetical protein BRD30_03990 [Bacteroidetes bacterium QH_2_63_10]
MRITTLGTVVVSLTIWAGVACQSTRPSAQSGKDLLHGVEEGMTPSQVRAVMGAPARTVRERGEIQWMMYESGPYESWVHVRDGRVTAVPRRAVKTASGDVP